MKKKTRKQIGIENFGKNVTEETYISRLRYGLKNHSQDGDSTFEKIFKIMWGFHAVLEDAEKDNLEKWKVEYMLNLILCTSRDEFKEELNSYNDLTEKQKKDLMKCFDTTYMMATQKFANKQFAGDAEKFFKWLFS